MRSAMFCMFAAALAVGRSARPAPAAEALDEAKAEAALQKNAEVFNKGDAKASITLFIDLKVPIPIFEAAP